RDQAALPCSMRRATTGSTVARRSSVRRCFPRKYRCEEFSTFLYPSLPFSTFLCLSLLFYSYLLLLSSIYFLLYSYTFFFTFYYHLPINLTQCFAAPGRYHSTLITHH